MGDAGGVWYTVERLSKWDRKMKSNREDDVNVCTMRVTSDCVCVSTAVVSLRREGRENTPLESSLQKELTTSQLTVLWTRSMLLCQLKKSCTLRVDVHTYI